MDRRSVLRSHPLARKLTCQTVKMMTADRRGTIRAARLRTAVSLVARKCRVRAMPAESRKRFSMIREFHFTDWFTLGNAVCGTGALFSSMTYLQTGYVERIYVACSLIFAGLVFDILDGRIARWRQKTSA